MIEEGSFGEGMTVLCAERPNDIVRVIAGVEIASFSGGLAKPQKTIHSYRHHRSIKSAIDSAVANAFSDVSLTCGIDEWYTTCLLQIAADKYRRKSDAWDDAIKRLHKRKARSIKECVR